MVDWKSLAQLSLGSRREEGQQPRSPDSDIHQILKATVNTENSGNQMPLGDDKRPGDQCLEREVGC